MIDNLYNYPTEKILAYFGYYNIENSKSYYLFKNSLGSKIFVYQDLHSDQYSYFIYYDFVVLDKKDLIIYLLQNGPINDESISQVINELEEIKEFEQIELQKKREKNFFINQIFGLKKPEEYFSILNQNIFIRNNEYSVILYKNDKPIDVLSSSQNSSYTVFGNTVGSYLKPGEDQSIITFDPTKIIKEIELVRYNSIFFCSEELSFSNYKKIQNLENITFFRDTENEKFFAIKYSIYRYNELNPNNPIFIYKNDCVFYLEINMYDKSKLEILNFNSNFNKILAKNISNEIKGNDYINTMYSIENKILTFRFTYNKFHLDKTLDFLSEYINEPIKYIHK